MTYKLLSDCKGLSQNESRQWQEYGSRSNDESLNTREVDGICQRLEDVLLGGPIEQGAVFSLYGIGGQGKTVFLQRLGKKLSKRLREKKASLDNKMPFVFLDVSDCLEKPQYLKEIAKQLMCQQVPCSCFLYAYYREFIYSNKGISQLRSELEADIIAFQEACGPGSQDGVLASLREALGELGLSMTTEVADYLAEIPLPSMLREIIRFSSASREIHEKHIVSMQVEHALEKIKKSIDDCQPIPLEDCLKKDIENWVVDDAEVYGADAGRRIVFMIDTFESLCWKDQTGYGLAKEAWVKKLSRTQSTLWVIAGRRRVAWPNVVQFPIRFDRFDENEARDYLKLKGIVDEGVMRQIFDLSGMLPIYLDLCVRILVDEGGVLDDVHSSAELPKCYLKYLDESMQICVKACAVLRQWDSNLLKSALRDLGPSPANRDRVSTLSFVGKEADGTFFMHEVVADILCDAMREELLHFDGIPETYADFRGNLEACIVTTKRSSQPPSVKSEKVYALYKCLDRLDEIISLKDRGDEEAVQWFDMRTAYAASAGCAKKASDRLDICKQTLVSCEQNFDAEAELTLRAKLAHAAALTGMYLEFDDASYQEKAVIAEEEVLDVIERDADGKVYSDELRATVRNSLGISYTRAKLFEKALPMLESVHEPLAKKPDEKCEQIDAARINNYGFVCHNYAMSLPQEDENRKNYLERALEAYGKSVRIRERVLSPDDRLTLIVRTNAGKALCDMGRFAEAREQLEYEFGIYKKAGYLVDSDPECLRCQQYLAFAHLECAKADFHAVISSTDSNGISADAIASALDTAQTALVRFNHVLEGRRTLFGDGHAVTVKAATEVEACKKAIAEMKNAARRHALDQ